MSTNAELSFDVTRGRLGLVWTATWVLLIGALLYVLSFGPAVRLTSALIDGSGGQLRMVRKPACPSWALVVHGIYRPLCFATSGQAGRLPQRVLLWYVMLWG
jgi:hypothetical protein